MTRILRRQHKYLLMMVTLYLLTLVITPMCDLTNLNLIVLSCLYTTVHMSDDRMSVWLYSIFIVFNTRLLGNILWGLILILTPAVLINTCLFFRWGRQRPWKRGRLLALSVWCPPLPHPHPLHRPRPPTHQHLSLHPSNHPPHSLHTHSRTRHLRPARPQTHPRTKCLRHGG